jgi:hypothetical protein
VEHLEGVRLSSDRFKIIASSLSEQIHAILVIVRLVGHIRVRGYTNEVELSHFVNLNFAVLR